MANLIKAKVEDKGEMFEIHLTLLGQLTLEKVWGKVKL